ncbi:MAG: aldolase/citrate lyase family protein [Alphaproteobacteria bacterium]|nr:aldolase/citrate lyase family protein [Alphaproteobacteria bacterium]
MAGETFRARLAQRLLGTFVKTAAHQVVEILALGGLDYIVIDTEHAPFSPADLDRMILAGRAGGMPVLVRVPGLDPVPIAQCLDMGADGIVVPHVRSAVEARAAVVAAKYKGRRGFSPSPRAGCYGSRGADAYRAAADGETSVWCQIEDAEALGALDEIAAVDDVDCLFVGRADLALSLGTAGTGDPRVSEAVRAVGGACRSAGRTAGLFVPGTAEIPDRAQEGYSAFICGSDQSWLLEQARARRAAFAV